MLFHSLDATPTYLILGEFAVSVEVERVEMMVKKTNEVELYFQVTFSLALPSSLFKIPIISRFHIRDFVDLN